MGRDPFCIAWTDIYTDETGFRVELKYSPAHKFVYHLQANVNEVYPPPSEWPPHKDSDIELMVYAETPGGEILVDGFALDVN
jgi:hypothetical protein